MDHRATGWLTPSFDHAWRLVLLHACARYRLASPAYVLMPDHVHLLWIGLHEESDQHVALEFLRKHLRPILAPCDWQRQAYDHVLRPEERLPDAFQRVAHYIMENPVRARLVEQWTTYPYLGCCMPGYPSLDIRAENYWELFWRIHNRMVQQGG
jgi:REP element-mobilizing transposase RayT